MSTYHEIQADDLLNMLATQAVLLVDVRNDDEVARGVLAWAKEGYPFVAINAGNKK